MDADRLQAAIMRIEAASQRIAGAARGRAGDEPDAELARRHERLRAQAQAALADLDQLILELDA